MVSYDWVATEAGYPRRAKAVREYLARTDEVLPWWRVVRVDGCLTSPGIDGQILAPRRDGVHITGRRGAVPMRDPYGRHSRRDVLEPSVGRAYTGGDLRTSTRH